MTATSGGQDFGSRTPDLVLLFDEPNSSVQASILDRSGVRSFSRQTSDGQQNQAPDMVLLFDEPNRSVQASILGRRPTYSRIKLRTPDFGLGSAVRRRFQTAVGSCLGCCRRLTDSRIQLRTPFICQTSFPDFSRLLPWLLDRLNSSRRRKATRGLSSRAWPPQPSWLAQ